MNLNYFTPKTPPLKNFKNNKVYNENTQTNISTLGYPEDFLDSKINSIKNATIKTDHAVETNNEFDKKNDTSSNFTSNIENNNSLNLFNLLQNFNTDNNTNNLNFNLQNILSLLNNKNNFDNNTINNLLNFLPLLSNKNSANPLLSLLNFNNKKTNNTMQTSSDFTPSNNKKIKDFKTIDEIDL